MPWSLKHTYATFANSNCFILDLLENGSSATCECNMSFSYLETGQHGSNMTSLKLQQSHETCETWNCNIRVKLIVLLLHHM